MSGVKTAFYVFTFLVSLFRLFSFFCNQPRVPLPTPPPSPIRSHNPPPPSTSLSGSRTNTLVCSKKNEQKIRFESEQIPKQTNKKKNNKEKKETKTKEKNQPPVAENLKYPRFGVPPPPPQKKACAFSSTPPLPSKLAILLQPPSPHFHTPHTFPHPRSFIRPINHNDGHQEGGGPARLRG